MRLIHGNKGRAKLVSGALTLARAVGATLGPGGHVVLIDDKFGRVIATKDGVTVARAVTLPDNEEHMGAKLLAEAALKVAEEAGDGTTTCVVIAARLLELAHELVAAGHDPLQLATEIRTAADLAENLIWQNSVPIPGAQVASMVSLVANVSTNGDRKATAAVVAAYEHVGVEGVVVLRDGASKIIEVEVQEGLRIDRGWTISAMAPKEGDVVSMPQMMVLVAHRTISSARELMPCLEHAAANGCGLLVVCEYVIGDAQRLLVKNHQTAATRCMTVIPPGFDDRQRTFLEDLAVWCGAKVQDLETAPLDPRSLGLVERAEQRRKLTILTGPAGDPAKVAERIAALETMRTTANAYDRDKLVKSIGRLRGKVAEIAVGAPTEIEAREIRDRIEDGINAVRVAFHSGIQPGGGWALLRASVDGAIPHTPGGKALQRALRAPCWKILRNAGDEDGQRFAAALEEAKRGGAWGSGMDAYGTPCTMLSFPDPTAVVVQALRAAVSVTTTLLMAETTVTNAE